MRKALVLLFVVLLCTPALTHAGKSPTRSAKSLVITGAVVVDGSGRKAFASNVRIVGDRIANVGTFRPGPDDELIEARGMILAPGFIDIHNHSEHALETEPTVASQVSQGITTIAVGPDGGSPWPVGSFLTRMKEKPAAVNVLSFVGHATVRQMVLKNDYNRTATKEEIVEMTRLVERGCEKARLVYPRVWNTTSVIPALPTK